MATLDAIVGGKWGTGPTQTGRLKASGNEQARALPAVSQSNMQVEGVGGGQRGQDEQKV